jgi:hypothetical protein
MFEWFEPITPQSIFVASSAAISVSGHRHSDYYP